MTHRQDPQTPEDAASRPLGAEQDANGAPDAGPHERAAGGRTGPWAIHQSTTASCGTCRSRAATDRALTDQYCQRATRHHQGDRPMANLHLIISRPEPGEWLGRLDVVEALEAAGWIGDDDMPLSILRHSSGAVWAVVGDTCDSGLDCPNGAVIEFPSDTPTVVIVAACLAAAATP